VLLWVTMQDTDPKHSSSAVSSINQL
jgi:hypothetical protein